MRALGAVPVGDGSSEFRVWAPGVSLVAVRTAAGFARADVPDPQAAETAELRR